MISKGWSRYLLGDISKFKYGKLPNKQFVSEIGKYPVFTGYKNSGFYPDYNCDKNQLIVVARGVGGTGDVKLTKEKCWLTNLSIEFLLDTSYAEKIFLYYYFLKDTLRHLDSGSAQSQITIDDLRRVEILIPNLPTQRRIANILSALDEKIELNRQTNVTLEAIAKSIFKEWFVDFNYPGATGEMVESDLGIIPKGWRVAAFDDELGAERGLSYKGAGLESGNAMPMHNLNSVYEGGGYKFSGIKYYSGEYKEKHIVRPGDLIVTNTEQGHKYLLIGYPAIVPSTFGDIGIYSHHIYRVKPKQHSYLTTDFVYQLLLQPEIREQVVGFANGTTVNMLKIEGLQKPKFILPPKQLVHKFSEMAENIRLKIEENIEQSATLASLRDALLPKLMSGEIEV